jgi:CRP-like cAMP-binding protein
VPKVDIVTEINAGGSFGEMALMNSAPRTASIRCVSSAWLGILDKSDYSSILGKYDIKLLDSKVKFIRKISLFKKWSKISVSRLIFQLSTE